MMMSGKRLLEKPHFEPAAKGVFRLGRLHLLAGHSRSSGQQLGKHGYQRLIAWQVVPVSQLF